MKDKISKLFDKDNTESYHVLLELELLSTESNEVYNYFDELLCMLNSERSSVRVRGFRLICSLSKWDKENRIEKNIDEILAELDDDIGTSLRQCLNKLPIILLYKPELSERIEKKLKSLNIDKYKETLKPLITKDINNILDNI